MPKQRAIVIGAGLGGLVCAARLLHAGVETIVLEASQRAGGKCGGSWRDGFCVDFAPHVFPTSASSELAKAALLLGEELRFVVKDPFALVCLGERRFNLPAHLGNLASLLRLALGCGFQLRHLCGIAQHYFQLLNGGTDLDPGRPRSVRDWLLRYTADNSYHAFVNLFTVLAFVVPYDVADAGEFAASFSRIAAGAGIGYPLGGCHELVDTLLRGIERRGGRVLFGHRADRIEIDGGAVKAVEVASRRFEADLVFSNAGIKSTVGLVGTSHFDQAYLARTQRLVESLGSVCVTYLLDRQAIEAPAVLVFPDRPGSEVCRVIHSGEYIGKGGNGCYVVVPSNFDPSLAPPGKQIVVATTIHPAEPIDQAGTELMLQSMEDGLQRLFPLLKGSIISREVTTNQQIAAESGRSSGEAIGIAQIVGQGGRQRPPAATPIRGLYVIGADTGSGAVGTDLAAKGGRTAAAEALDGARHADRTVAATTRSGGSRSVDRTLSKVSP